MRFRYYHEPGVSERPFGGDLKRGAKNLGFDVLNPGDFGVG